MAYFQRFILVLVPMYWTVKTKCLFYRLELLNNIILRKIKYKPLLVDSGLDDGAIEFDVIKANYFCYTYPEMYYILKFGYTSAELNKDKNFICSNYFESVYISIDGSINTPPIIKYFCEKGRRDCRTNFNNELVEVSTKIKSNHEEVNETSAFLFVLRNFKKCEVCGRRIQIWVGEIQFERISNIICRESYIQQMSNKIFEILD